MSDNEIIKVPDIGDFEDVEVIEVLVSEGDTLEAEDSIITIESDKSSMEVPSPKAGTVGKVLVSVGDKVSEGSDLIELQAADADAGDGQDDGDDAPAAESSEDVGYDGKGSGVDDDAAEPSEAGDRKPSPDAVQGDASDADEQYDIVVLGAGPGGYTAAFRAADLGQNVLLIERYDSLGGVCLNVGCIPSKALLHTSEVIQETQEMADHGITFSKPEIDLDKLRGFKDDVIGKLTGGLKGLAKQRKVTVAHGVAEFTSSNTIKIDGQDGKTVGFTHAIIAAGSQSIQLPGFPYDDDRLVDSTGALELRDIPERMLVIGGGIIGLEMGCVYAGLGTKITVVELSDGLMPGADRDLVKPLEKRLKGQFENIFVGSKVTGIEAGDDGLTATFEGGKAPETDTFDRVLYAIGRTPNGKQINAAAAGVEVDDQGFIRVDSQQRTNVPHIFAIGDIVGQPMLAHKATHEGKVAAEVASGLVSHFDAKTIPSVAYTDPEVAWMGLTEIEAKEQDIPFEKAVFPWQASGRSLSMGRSEGMTKVIYDPETKRLLGAGIVGRSAGELIAEAVLALEMGADIEDVALTVHAHPTLSETFNFATEVAEGTVTDIYAPKKKKKAKS